MKQRVIWGAIALLILLPFLLHGGLLFQAFVGFLAMIGVAEMLPMKHLEFFSIEGVLSMLGAFVLTVPLDNYFTSLPIDSNFAVYGLLVFFLLAGTVINCDDYSFDEVLKKAKNRTEWDKKLASYKVAKDNFLALKVFENN